MPINRAIAVEFHIFLPVIGISTNFIREMNVLILDKQIALCWKVLYFLFISNKYYSIIQISKIVELY